MWRKRNRRQKQAKLKKRRWLTSHHLLPKCRGGKGGKENLLQLHWPKHEAWHRLFGLRTPEEVIAVLQRMCRMKGRTKHKFAA